MAAAEFAAAFSFKWLRTRTFTGHRRSTGFAAIRARRIAERLTHSIGIPEHPPNGRAWRLPATTANSAAERSFRHFAKGARMPRPHGVRYPRDLARCKCPPPLVPAVPRIVLLPIRRPGSGQGNGFQIAARLHRDDD